MCFSKNTQAKVKIKVKKGKLPGTVPDIFSSSWSKKVNPHAQPESGHYLSYPI